MKTDAELFYTPGRPNRGPAYLSSTNTAMAKYKKPKKLLEKPDAIVIGSGIGGLGIAPGDYCVPHAGSMDEMKSPEFAAKGSSVARLVRANSWWSSRVLTRHIASSSDRPETSDSVDFHSPCICII